MTVIPREVARRQPANQARTRDERIDDGRTIDGHWRAKRIGTSGARMVQVIVLLLLASGLAGLLLSLWSQQR